VGLLSQVTEKMATPNRSDQSRSHYLGKWAKVAMPGPVLPGWPVDWLKVKNRKHIGHEERNQTATVPRPGQRKESTAEPLDLSPN
jgi:hypothetical protein